MSRESVSTDYNVDVLIIGGGFAGAAAVKSAAESGASVMLAEARTYLGEEMTAANRYVMLHEELQQLTGILQWEQVALIMEGSGDRTLALIPDGIKLGLENILLEKEVKLLYNARPLRWVRRNDGYVVTLAGKFGTKTVRALQIIDASSDGAVAAMLPDSGYRYPEKSSITVERIIELQRVDTEGLDEVSLSTAGVSLGIDPIEAISALPERGHVRLRFGWQEPYSRDSFWKNELEIKARFLTMRLFRELKETQAAFAQAELINGAHELTLPPRKSIAGQAGRPYSALPGVWIASGNADLPEKAAAELQQSFLSLDRLGSEIGRLAAEEALSAPYAAQSKYTVTQGELPVTRLETEVLVIGGGTSGASAAIAAAEQGVSTLLFEMNSGLGGSGTVGGVDSYWYGRRIGFTAHISRLVREEHEWMGLTWQGKTAEKWNIEAKMFALLKAASQAGVRLFWRSVLISVIMEGNRAVGAMIALPDRLVEVRAACIIDATGDGDVAVMAGAPYLYGSERDSITMWYSKVPQIKPGLNKNNFTSTVDVGDAEDYTRAILTARRRFIGYDHSPYIAPRESRHIIGGVLLSLNDQLALREWPDVINICFSNYDIKGHSCSDWIRMGLLPPNLEIEIPYRALLPNDVEGMLVVGKAISGTHDALPAIRMQADLENLGAAGGIAAALAAMASVTPREVPLDRLQKELVKLEILPESYLSRTPRVDNWTEEQLADWVAKLDDREKLYEFANMGFEDVYRGLLPMAVVCMADTRVLPYLRKEAENPRSTRRLTAAKALAWHGDAAGVPVLLEEMESYLDAPELPGRDTSIKFVTTPPDHGAMPELAYLMYTLAMAGDSRAAAAAAMRAVTKLKSTWEKFTDAKHGLFYYVDSICHMAERFGNSDFLPALEVLRREPLFKGRLSNVLLQPDFFEERAAYLDLVIARALARCGDRDGLLTLSSYLGDVRKILVRHAHQELAVLTGVDFGTSTSSWEEWIRSLTSWEPKPWKADSAYR